MAEEQEDEVEVEHEEEEEEVEEEVVVAAPEEILIPVESKEEGEQRKRVKTLEEKVKLLEKELVMARRENCGLRQVTRMMDGKMRRWIGGGGGAVGRGGQETGGLVVREIKKSALELFPIEVWGEIFSHLDHAQDLENCYKASFSWNPVLKSRKTTFLFPKVFSILAKNSSFVPQRSNIFELRLVCRSWRDAVDVYLQHHECHFNLHEHCTQDDDHDCWGRRLRFCFVTSQGVEDFLTDMLERYQGPNPFITRSVTFIDPHRGRLHESNQLWTSVITLLEHVGNQIFYCNLRIYSDQSADIFYKIVRRCLRLMPNLKVLEVGYNSNQNAQEMEEELAYLVEASPFPKMPGLSVLVTSQLPQILFNELLSKFTRIQKLVVEKQSTGFYEEIAPPRLDYLVELTLSLSSREDVTKLGLIPWNLRTLSLVLFCDQYDNLSHLFQTLAHFGGTLQTLNLKFDLSSSPAPTSGGVGADPTPTPKLVLQTTSQNLRLYLPRLQKLRLHVANVELKDIDFILPLQHLTKLILVMDHHDVRNEAAEVRPYPEDEDAVIRFFGILDHLYDSNIWKLCHYLKSVFLKIRSDRNYWRFFRRFLYIRENYVDMDPDPV